MAIKRCFNTVLAFVRSLFLLILIPTIGGYISILHDDWTWFARFGALMVAFAVLDFLSAYLYDQSTVAYQYLRNHAQKSDLTESDLEQISHTANIKRLKQSGMAYLRAVIGAFVGTLIWGFGDLVGCYF